MDTTAWQGARDQPTPAGPTSRYHRPLALRNQRELLLHRVPVPGILYMYYYITNINSKASPRERSDRGRFMPSRQKILFIPGCVQGAIIKFVGRSVCACVYHSLFFTDFESCTRPISTNPDSMASRECCLLYTSPSPRD